MDNIINTNLIPPSPNIDINTLNPFTRFCCSIGAIPASYLVAMSYEEQLLWLCDYLQNTVIPTVNNNGEAVAELQGLYTQLKNYVDNYFTNLDVQEEINNKLDKMASDGTLTVLIEKYLNPYLSQQNNIIGEQQKEIDNLNNITNLHSSQISNLISENNPTEGNSELLDIRVAENGLIYKTAGDSVRNQVKNLDDLIKSTINSYNNGIFEKSFILLEEFFEEGGINSSNGQPISNPTSIRSNQFFTFNENYLKVKFNGDLLLRQIFVYSQNEEFIKVITIGFDDFLVILSKNYKYKFLFNNGTVDTIQNLLNKTSFNVIYLNNLKTDDIFKINKLNLINPNLAIYGTLDTLGNLIYGKNKNGGYVVFKIPVNENLSYFTSEPTFRNAFFNSNDVLIGEVHYVGNNPLNNPFTPPPGTDYMLSVKTKNSNYYLNSIEQKYYDYKSFIIEPNNNIPDDYKPILFKDINITSKLKNKTINIFGDSISSTDYTMPYWGDIIKSKTGCIINNYGISATSLAHTNDRHLWNYHFTKLDASEIGYIEDDPSTWSTGNCFCERFTKVDTNADAIVIMGGTNDNNVPLGEWNSNDTTTFYGALNVLLKGICEKMKGKIILICTPIQSNSSFESNQFDSLNLLRNTPSSNTLSLQLRSQAIIEKCKQYGLPCLDLFNFSGINGIDTNKIYYRPNDSLHPSEIGQVRLASLIQSKLEELFM